MKIINVLYMNNFPQVYETKASEVQDNGQLAKLMKLNKLKLPAKLLMREHQSLQPNGELHITTAHHVLNLEVQELGRKTELLYHTCIFSGS